MTLRERLLAAVVVSDDGCWLWQATSDAKGYGRITVGSRRDGTRNTSARSHRVAYEVFVGPIPEGLEIDHLCRVTSCVNPEHLEAVTHRENILRGLAPPAVNARRASCVDGHAFDARNRRGARTCRTCRNQSSRAARKKYRYQDAAYWRAYRARRTAAGRPVGSLK